MQRGVSEPGLARGSGKLAGAVARLERDRLWVGAVAAALRQWSRVAHRPGLALSGGCGCALCNPFYMNDEREVLELALHALPRGAARELRALVEPLDALYLARSWQNPSTPAHYAWWARRYRG
ncbi:hypothetical protein KGA66_27675 [Actinocrinis puniceicyclus]|uniref:Uncharacterized protein n=1 Tax=Actinocrinis puniceicyclus TaxID=977794 RepID=A0A8J8BG72_9ACTN|nr:hypothetical protein [Actinocrinis puniceicyclus]MBS2966846.1 hypothetical protein [Actinocrinis puniceicyclus]